MKKLLFLLLLIGMIISSAKAQTIGIYNEGQPTINLGDYVTLMFKIDGSNVAFPVYIVYNDSISGSNTMVVAEAQQNKICFQPERSTTIAIVRASNSNEQLTIDPNHSKVKITVNNGNNAVIFNFSIPADQSEVCKDHGAIWLKQFVTCNVTNYFEFSGPGVTGEWFKPADAATGQNEIQCKFYWNGLGHIKSALINVHPLPTVSFNPPSEMFVGSCLNLGDYTSPRGGTFSGDDVSPTGFFNPQRAGLKTIKYTVTGEFGCENTAERQIFVKPCGFGVDEEEEPPFAIYPNPASEQINITLDRDAKVTIHNIMGQTMMTTEGHAGVNTLDISHLSSGIYLLKAATISETFTKK